MPSPEGQGNARDRWQRAWDAYERAAHRVVGPVITPAVRPFAKWLAGRMTADLIGFYVMWHLEGGFEGLQRLGMSRSAIYRRIGTFRKVMGEHPDTFVMPGLSIDVDAYLAATRTAASAARVGGSQKQRAPAGTGRRVSS